MPSYRRIDYSLRSAKFAERKALCELISRLRPFKPVHEYLYVGFGSVWFADYILFHKTLGIQEMISIERVAADQPRFEFNKPFANIDIRIGTAADVLPELDWARRQVLWLDYDDPLSPSILDDVRTVANRASSGTMLAVSVQAERLHSGSHDDGNREPIESPGAFRQEFGDARTPDDLRHGDLLGWRLSATIRKALIEEVDDALGRRNVGLTGGQELTFRQVAAFEYVDGAKMATIVGLFLDNTEEGKFEACGFDELEYFRDGMQAVRINVPKLTPRETRRLDQLLPDLPEDQLGPIPLSDARRYASHYRYLPNYAPFEP